MVGGQVVGCHYGGDIRGTGWGANGGLLPPPPFPSRVFSPRPRAFPPSSPPPVPAVLKVTGGRTPQCCGGDEGTSPEGGSPGAPRCLVPSGRHLPGAAGPGGPRSGAGTERSRAGPRRSLPPRSVTCGGAGQPLRGRWDRAPVPGTGHRSRECPRAPGADHWPDTEKKAPGTEIRN